MFNYLIRRALAALPVMLVVAFFVFSLLFIAPGDPAAIIAGDHATAEEVARVRQYLGLDRPFLTQFGAWALRIIQGDLGNSVFTDLPVTDLLMQRLGPTLSLVAVTITLAMIVAIPMGTVAAARAGGLLDRVLMSFAVLGFSVPVFIIGYMLAYLFGVHLKWLPVQGYTPLSEGVRPWLTSLILPAFTLGGAYIALIARITRAALLDVLKQDYIRTARAKGLAEPNILFVHALKNAAVPVITATGLGIALLIGGAVVTESVFAIPGVGRLTVDAILRRDYPVIQGIVLFFSFSYVVINLLIDVAYTLVDPRIRY